MVYKYLYFVNSSFSIIGLHIVISLKIKDYLINKFTSNRKNFFTKEKLYVRYLLYVIKLLFYFVKNSISNILV